MALINADSVSDTSWEICLRTVSHNLCRLLVVVLDLARVGGCVSERRVVPHDLVHCGSEVVPGSGLGGVSESHTGGVNNAVVADKGNGHLENRSEA